MGTGVGLLDCLNMSRADSYVVVPIEQSHQLTESPIDTLRRCPLDFGDVIANFDKSSVLDEFLRHLIGVDAIGPDPARLQARIEIGTIDEHDGSCRPDAQKESTQGGSKPRGSAQTLGRFEAPP